MVDPHMLNAIRVHVRFHHSNAITLYVVSDCKVQCVARTEIIILATSTKGEERLID